MDRDINYGEFSFPLQFIIVILDKYVMYVVGGLTLPLKVSPTPLPRRTPQRVQCVRTSLPSIRYLLHWIAPWFRNRPPPLPAKN